MYKRYIGLLLALIVTGSLVTSPAIISADNLSGGNYPVDSISARIDSFSPGNLIEIPAPGNVNISVTFTNTGSIPSTFIANATVWDAKGKRVAAHSKRSISALQPNQQITMDWLHSVIEPGEYSLQFAIYKDADNLITAKPDPAQKLIRGEFSALGSSYTASSARLQLPAASTSGNMYVDDSLSNGIIKAELVTMPDALEIRLTNNKPYWTNWEISTVGDMVPQPVGLVTMLCNNWQVLPPNETLRYSVDLNTTGAATFFADLTVVSGLNGTIANTTDATIKLISPIAYCIGEDVQIIFEIIDSLPDFADVPINLGHAFQPNTSLTDRFKYLGSAAKAMLSLLNTPDNRSTLADWMSQLKWFINNPDSGAQILVKLNAISQVIKLLDVFWQEAHIIWDASVGQPAGSIMVVYLPSPKEFSLTTSVDPAGGGTVSPSAGKYASGEQITLTAWPTRGYKFDHWGGDASGTATQSNVVMSGHRNCVAFFTQNAKADLTVSPVVFEPLAATLGSPISVSYVVMNKGGTASGPFHCRISLGTTDWGTTYSLGNFAMATLEPGAAREVTITTNPVPANTPAANYYVTAYADGFQVINESDEMNNIGSSTPEKISIELNKPSIITDNASYGTINSVVLNGNLTALGSATSVSVYFQYRTETGPTLTSTTLARTATGPFGISISNLSPGTLYYFKARADGGAAGTAAGIEKSFITPAQTAPVIERASVDSSGNQGNGQSISASISEDGRYVAFESRANNLVTGDTNGRTDIFVRDRLTSTTSRVSVDSNGNQGNDDSHLPSISADGRYIAYMSWATNLVQGDTNGAADIFVRDRQTSTTTRVSVDINGIQGNTWSDGVGISADGTHVAFSSIASNFVPGDSTGSKDIFVHGLQDNTTTMVSVDSDGNMGHDLSEYPCINADGRYIAFMSWADTLVPGDSNGLTDIFIRDQQTNTTALISISYDGGRSSGDSGKLSPSSISADGRYVAFDSYASNLVPSDTNHATDVFVRDRLTDTNTRVSIDSDGIQSNGTSYSPSISADGCHVVFVSDATNLVPGDTNGKYDIFVRDMTAGTTTRVSLDSTGNQSNNSSYGPSISADGNYVAFESDATNIVTGDTNGQTDIFVTALPTTAIIPTITNASGATEVTANTAIINGNLASNGDTATTVVIYGGTADGGTNPANWQLIVNLGIRESGAFFLGVTGLSPTKKYYYRCAATNAAGTAWAPETSSFTTQSTWEAYWEGPGKEWFRFSSGAPR